MYGALGAVFVFFSPLYGQEIIPNLNAYRTALDVGGIGDWDNPLTWEMWDGEAWEAATAPPDKNNDVFIEKDNEVRLTKNEEVADLFLFASADAGKKLNLQVYGLAVYGELKCFTKTGESYALYNSTSLTEDWIYPETGSIVFRGSTRTIVDRSSWSGNNGQSRFAVVFNPDPGDTLTINAVFKASSFVVQSGVVYQTVNRDGTPATSSFSFNFQDKISLSDYGDFTIEADATLISEATANFGELIFRTTNRPASNFHLKEGGNLILLGSEPIIEAVNIQLEGNVYYSGSSGTQRFIRGSMDGVSSPMIYNHLFFEGEAIKQAPEFLELRGSLSYLGGGSLNTGNTSIHFTGNADQEVLNISLDLQDVGIHKSSGTLFFDNDLHIRRRFEMTAGQVDFSDNQLSIHGDYEYGSGSWSNLARLIYQNIPSILTASNSTFPFVDAYLGGVRTVQLSGTLSSPEVTLDIAFQQFPGVNWDPGFDDDGVPILYLLNSYFQFSLSDFPATDQLEVWISADNLIIAEDDHLRITGSESAAPGSHLPATDGWARRAVNLPELNGQRLTLGTTGIASILPVSWLSFGAEELPEGNLIHWSTTKEENCKAFGILKSSDAVHFEEIGQLPGKGYTNEAQQYQFLDIGPNLSKKIYYRILQIDFDEKQDFSPVFSLILKEPEEQWKIYPNPYQNRQHPLTIILPAGLKKQDTHVKVKNASGILIAQETGTVKTILPRIKAQLEAASPGAYFILFATDNNWQVIRWIKK